MSIKGLSTREDVNPRFLSLGKLVKGGPKDKQGKVGEDLDHFRFKPADATDEELAAAFFSVYGKEPNHIKFYLPYDEMERCFSSWREDYGQNQMLKRRCDGEYWVSWVEGARRYNGVKRCTLPMKDTENRCPECPLAFVGRLEVILPPLWEAGFVGLVTIETHSINDIGAIAGKLMQCEPLTGKEFVLWRQEQKIGVPIKGKRVAVEKSLVFVELTRDWLQMQYIEAAKRQALARLNGAIAIASLEAGEGEEELPFSEPPLDEEWGASYVDLETGEVIEDEEQEPEQEPEQAEQEEEQPLKPRDERPYPPPVIKAKIEQYVEARSKAGATDAQRQLVAMKLRECFAGEEDADSKAHSVLNWLCGFESTKAVEMKQGHVDGIMKWVLLDGNKDSSGDYPLHPNAPAEAAAIVREALVAEGQQEMGF